MRDRGERSRTEESTAEHTGIRRHRTRVEADCSGTLLKNFSCSFLRSATRPHRKKDARGTPIGGETQYRIDVCGKHITPPTHTQCVMPCMLRKIGSTNETVPTPAWPRTQSKLCLAVRRGPW